MPNIAMHGLPQMAMAHNKNMAVPIPLPMPPQFMNHFRPEAYGFMSAPPPPQQPYPMVTEEERELLDQLRARKRASEQPQTKQVSIVADPSLSPPSLRKRKSLSDDPRKRRPRTTSKDGEPDDLDLNSLRLDGYEGADLDSASPRARPYPEIVVNPAAVIHSRPSTPASASASTSTPLWSENERHTPPSPHHLLCVTPVSSSFSLISYFNAVAQPTHAKRPSLKMLPWFMASIRHCPIPHDPRRPLPSHSLRLRPSLPRVLIGPLSQLAQRALWSALEVAAATLDSGQLVLRLITLPALLSQPSLRLRQVHIVALVPRTCLKA